MISERSYIHKNAPRGGVNAVLRFDTITNLVSFCPCSVMMGRNHNWHIQVCWGRVYNSVTPKSSLNPLKTCSRKFRYGVLKRRKLKNSLRFLFHPPVTHWFADILNQAPCYTLLYYIRDISSVFPSMHKGHYTISCASACLSHDTIPVSLREASMLSVHGLRAKHQGLQHNVPVSRQ